MQQCHFRAIEQFCTQFVKGSISFIHQWYLSPRLMIRVHSVVFPFMFPSLFPPSHHSKCVFLTVSLHPSLVRSRALVIL